jgi:hypothetical protein
VICGRILQSYASHLPITQRRGSLDPIEVALIGVTIAVVTLVATHQITAINRSRQAEARSKFGGVYSGGPEDFIVRDHFHEQRGGVFVDVGAGPARKSSNTYLLEQRYGWSGVAVDAQADYGPEYATLRPHTRFVAAYLSRITATCSSAATGKSIR